jgi:hypothetical protein
VFSEVLTYPVRGEDAEETLLVGTVLALATGLLVRLDVLAALAVIPVSLLAGYVLAVLRESAADATRPPPSFSDVRALATDGLRAMLVAVGYLVVPAVVLGVTVGGASGGVRPANLGTTAVVLGGGTVVLFLSLAFAYLLPAALAAVARSGRLRSAVAVGDLARTVTDARYFVGWVGALAVGAVAVLLFAALASLGRPGEVVAFAGGFYWLVTVTHLLGRAIGEP